MEEGMGLSRRNFTREFKLAALERIESGESLAAVARALEVNPNLLQRWRQEFHAWPGSAFPGKGRGRAEPDRVAQLERKIGQQTLEIDFLKGCLQRIEQQRELQAVLGKPLSISKSKARAPES
jgi:transposase-like protein